MNGSFIETLLSVIVILLVLLGGMIFRVELNMPKGKEEENKTARQKEYPFVFLTWIIVAAIAVYQFVKYKG